MATKIERSNVTIANGAATSGAVTVPLDKTPLAVIVPSVMTGTTLKFEVSDDGATYRKLYSGATEYSVAISASESRHVVLDVNAFRSVIGGPTTTPTAVRIVSSSNEGAARTLQLVFGIS